MNDDDDAEDDEPAWRSKRLIGRSEGENGDEKQSGCSSSGPTCRAVQQPPRSSRKRTPMIRLPHQSNRVSSCLLSHNEIHQIVLAKAAACCCVLGIVATCIVRDLVECDETLHDKYKPSSMSPKAFLFLFHLGPLSRKSRARPIFTLTYTRTQTSLPLSKLLPPILVFDVGLAEVSTERPIIGRRPDLGSRPTLPVRRRGATCKLARSKVAPLSRCD